MWVSTHTGPSLHDPCNIDKEHPTQWTLNKEKLFSEYVFIRLFLAFQFSTLPTGLWKPQYPFSQLPKRLNDMKTTKNDFFCGTSFKRIDLKSISESLMQQFCVKVTVLYYKLAVNCEEKVFNWCCHL